MMARVIGKSRQAVVGGMIFGSLATAGAADITVANANDQGPGSLRQAVLDLAPGGVIDFDQAVFTPASHTIMLASELVLSKGVTLDAGNLGKGVRVSGSGSTRLLRVTETGDLSLKRITLNAGNGASPVANGFGGAIFNAGIARLEDCTLSGNRVINYGGAISSSGSLEIIRSTISGNSAGSLGGGIYSANSGKLTLTNSTLSGNSAALYGGAIYHTSPLTLIHSTLSANHASNKGGGIYNDFASALTLKSSIVAGNTAPDSPDFFGLWTASPFNLTGGDPLLSSLGNYGGPTQTMPPLPGSPALDAADAESLATDQRGFSRVLASGPDIGAVEAAAGAYNPAGLTLYARVPAADSAGHFEISADPDFLPTVSTFAGTGAPGLLDAPRFSAKFGYPSAVARDLSGNVFIADAGNHRIRMLTPDGKVSTIAGSGNFSGLASGPGSIAAFSFPSAVAVGPDQIIYVADAYNHRICKLVRPLVAGGEWTVESLAGPSNPGNAGLVNQPGSAARFNYPYGLSLDGDGNVFVADALNHVIRKITPGGGVSTYAGSGVAGILDSTTALTARFDTPEDVIVAGGRIFVADTGNHCIREITRSGALADDVTTVAGSPIGVSGDADGTGTLAEFNSPAGLMVALDGNLVVADSENQVLRRIVIENTEMVTTVVSGDLLAGGQQVSAVLDVVALGLDPGATYYFRWVSTTTGTTRNLGTGFVL
jgi:predicted outer membrane repeat protein